ncbi:MAG: adenylate/guanylate cyclase domain-containing protein [Candidatus Limnocylindrales bacterium]
MACPRCNSPIRAGQKFCAECGLALSGACPNCGAAYEGSPKFCAECGTGLPGPSSDTAPSTSDRQRALPPAAERRYVSILFADLVGFTTLSEDQDPEEVRDLLSRYFDTAREVILGYGGTVEKFIGDAVMAIWGAPIAREDDPERAVRAALELVGRIHGMAAAGKPLALRAAVLSGDAAVTLGAAGQGMVAGDLVNTASRLQSVAPPDVVLVGESTYQATNAAIAYEPAGDQVLKGKQAPVAAWRALRVVARRGGEGREEGLEAPFVGRDEELRLLKEQVHAAEREQKLRVVAISGQAGIGKSRLAWELEKYLDGLAGPQLYHWHQGRTPAYGEGIAFWALGEMVRRRAHITEGEDESSTREKLRTSLDEFVLDAQERRWLEPALGALLGIDEANWAAREQLFSAWRTFFERIAERGPTVLVFEDLQWADNGLLDFIEHLLEWSRERPILVVTLARPELLERRPNFGMGHRALVALHLEPLDGRAMTSLLRGLAPGLDDADMARIVERAEGVPLFAVETIRALADGGHLVRRGDAYALVSPLPALDIPPTLRALIASRLDALGGEDRALLQDAAVLGLTFAVPALAALTERAPDEIEARLRTLAHKELVTLEADPRSPERGQYRFRQGLIRETSYATLAKRERRARHLAAARYYETLDDDELAGVRATHYLEAFRAAPEGEEGAALAAQARVALRSAADRAGQLHSPEQARAYLEQAMAVTFNEEDVNDLTMRVAVAAWASGDLAAAESYQRAALAWARANSQPELGVRLTARLAGWLFETSRIDEAMELLGGALEEPAVPPVLAMELTGQLARGHLFRNESEQGLAASSRALETAEQFDAPEASLQFIITKSWALSQMGRFREATALLIGAKQMADDENAMWPRIRSRFNLSSFSVIDDPHRGLQIALEGIAIDKQFGIAYGSMAGNAAENAFVVGDLDEVLRLEADAPELKSAMGAIIHGSAAVVRTLRGDEEAARGLMARFEDQMVGSTSAQDLANLRYVQAWLALARGRLDDAHRLAIESRDAHAGTGSQQSAVLAARSAVLIGDAQMVGQDHGWLEQHRLAARWLERSRRTIAAGLSAVEGRPEEALHAYRQLIEEWRAENLRLDLAFTLLQQARLLGDTDPGAAAGLEEAQRIFAAMGADRFVERIERTAAVRPATAKRSPALQSEDAAAARR